MPSGHPAKLPPLNMAVAQHQSMECDYSEPRATLPQNLALVRDGDSFARAAAVVTIVSVGAAVWNTPDGHRYTQAETNAGTAVQPQVMTPYVLTVQHPLSSVGGLTAGQKITGYAPGGTTAFGDTTQSCIGQPTVQNPQPGWQAVVILGQEMDRPVSTGSLVRPTITVFDVISNGQAVTPWGLEPVPY